MKKESSFANLLISMSASTTPLTIASDLSLQARHLLDDIFLVFIFDNNLGCFPKMFLCGCKICLPPSGLPLQSNPQYKQCFCKSNGDSFERICFFLGGTTHQTIPTSSTRSDMFKAYENRLNLFNRIILHNHFTSLCSFQFNISPLLQELDTDEKLGSATREG